MLRRVDAACTGPRPRARGGRSAGARASSGATALIHCESPDGTDPRSVRTRPGEGYAAPRQRVGSDEEEVPPMKLLPQPGALAAPNRPVRSPLLRVRHRGRARDAAARRVLWATTTRSSAWSCCAAAPQLRRSRRRVGQASMAAEGLDAQQPRSGEEWIAALFHPAQPAPAPGRAAQHHGEGHPRVPGRGAHAAQRPGRGAGVPLRPLGRAVLHRGHRRGLDGARGHARGAAATRRPSPTTGEPRRGRVALVLGAGNVSSIGPMDALYKLFVEDRVVLYKMHPVNAYLGPLLERGFRAADRGRLPARRLRRRRGGRLPRGIRAWRDPHHRLRQDLRCHRLRHRRGGARRKRGGSRCSTSRSPPNSATSAR